MTSASTLQTRVFVAPDNPSGFGVTSTIVYGGTESLLVDAQFSLANAHRVVAEILETGRPLTKVFISHVHPDHYLGLQAIHDAFPAANVYAYGETADEINDAFAFKIEHWGKAVLGLDGARRTVPVRRLDDSSLDVDGERVEVIGIIRGDSAQAAALWIPGLKTLIAADVVFSGAHVWVADARTPEERQEWLDVLDELEALQAEIVIAGHAPRDRPYDPDGIGFTRRCLLDFIENLKQAGDSADLISRMEALYPDAGVHICLELSSKILRDRYRWDGDYPESLRNRDAVI
jgi:glyoxylase-like metal-dependent hydrolase (beta-lactamase superfamily II)